MPEDAKRTNPYGLAAITRPAALLGLAAIGVAALCVAAAFAYVAGWLSPARLTQARIVDTFEQVNGPHPGFRRNHAKGVCFTGYFDSNGQGAQFSKAVVFRRGRTPASGRFALAGGLPFVSDDPKTVRSLAVRFQPPGAEEWRTGMINIPVFVVSTPQGFYENLAASRPDPATGHPDPAAMKAYMARHPETGRALKIIGAKPFSSGFADADYSALNAYRFVDAAGKSTPVRWSLASTEAFVAAPVAAAGTDPNYLFDTLAARVLQGPVRWRLMVTIGEAGDPTNDAAAAWPADRRQVEVGVLTVDRIEDEAPGNCRDINYDPLVLPDGVAPSDDPLLSARSAAYSVSFTRRAGERKPPSAVRPATANNPG